MKKKLKCQSHNKISINGEVKGGECTTVQEFGIEFKVMILKKTLGHLCSMGLPPIQQKCTVLRSNIKEAGFQ